MPAVSVHIPQPSHPLVPDFALRVATPADCQPLHSACFPERPIDEFTIEYKHTLDWQEKGRCVMLIGVGDVSASSTTAGILASGQLHFLGDVGEIANVAVTPSARGCGIGTAIIQALIDIAKQTGKTKVEIGVSAGNPRANALYQRLGFLPDRQLYLPSTDTNATMLQLTL